MQWYGALVPRIHAFLPTDTILEIACGHGRWTHFLKDQCRQLIAVDLSESCVQACEQRFADDSHISLFVNDGKSLDMIEDGSVDFVFSFDSLVHADDTVLQAYISQLPRVLKRNGAAFLHHSNLGEYVSRFKAFPKLKELLGLRRVHGKRLHWRDLSVSAARVEQFAEQVGLGCISQELVTWHIKWALTDCISTLVKKESPLYRHNRIYRNFSFIQEVAALSRLARLYGGLENGTSR